MTPAERRREGARLYEEIMRRPAPLPTSARIAGLIDFVFAEVWSRPGLSRRERRIVTISCAAASGERSVLGDHVYAALDSGDLTYGELQEIVLHFAVYAGWLKAQSFDEVVDEQWSARGRVATDVEPPSGADVSATTRRRAGADSFQAVTCMPPADFPTPYLDAIQDYVFGEMWTRSALSRRDRRWVTLACVGVSDAVIPISSHLNASLASGDVSYAELLEFVLQFATCSGWPKASAISVVLEQERARLDPSATK